MDLLKCCFGCATVLGCKSLVVRKAAFFPPNPPGYCFVDGELAPAIQLKDSCSRLRDPMLIPWLTTSVVVLSTARGSRIPCMFFHHADSESVLLFCHGNSTDIGYMWPHMVDLATQLDTSVFIFEYTGYGPFAGKPSEADLYADVRAAYLYLTTELRIPWKNIVVYGQSIGSAVACDIASERPCAGVVLHSPIASGLRIFAKKEMKTSQYDIFCNLEKMPYVRCPVFILHGTADKEVPICHSEWLSQIVALQSPPWWVPEGGHNDIESRFREEYITHLHHFLLTIRHFQGRFQSDSALFEAVRPISKSTPLTEIPLSHELVLPTIET